MARQTGNFSSFFSHSFLPILSEGAIYRSYHPSTAIRDRTVTNPIFQCLEYFYKQRQQQLLDLKAKKIDQLQFHEKAIRDHEDAIKSHKEAVKAYRNK